MRIFPLHQKRLPAVYFFINLPDSLMCLPKKALSTLPLRLLLSQKYRSPFLQSLDRDMVFLLRNPIMQRELLPLPTGMQ